MNIAAEGVLIAGIAGTNRACNTFPAVVALSDRTLLLTFRSGTTKDSPDERIRFYRSVDSGRSWKESSIDFTAPRIEGRSGSLKLCYLTEIDPGRRHVVAAALWVDRESYPGRGLFNEETEGCLPMAILLADSLDGGASWSAFRVVPMPAEIGPPSLTNPVLRFADGSLFLSIETNKHYEEVGTWKQRAVGFVSRDRGSSWNGPLTSAFDASGRIFHWDQRAALSPDGRIGAFHWTYDRTSERYLNVHRRISADGGRSWSSSEDLGFADQPSHPAVLADGSVLLAWVDRFGSPSIRARIAPEIAAPFRAETEIVIYRHGEERSAEPIERETGELLGAMSLWTFGLPFAESLPDGSVLVLYYAGDESAIDIRWCRIEV